MDMYDIVAGMTHASYTFGALGERKDFDVWSATKSVQPENKEEKYLHRIMLRANCFDSVKYTYYIYIYSYMWLSSLY